MKTDLTVSQKAIVPIASFAAAGNIPCLKQALAEGLDAGLTINEIKQVLVQLYVYAGFPRSLNALAAFSQILQEREQNGMKDEPGKEAGLFPTGGKTSLELGREVQTALVGAPVQGGLMEFAPDIDYYLKAHLFGDIFGRDNLDWQTREIATVAFLASMTGTVDQLRSHFAMSMNAGVTEEQLHSLTTILRDKVDATIGENARLVLEETVTKTAKDKGENIQQHGTADSFIFPRGGENVAFNQYFTGTSYLNMLTTEGVPVGNVTFEPGCRNFWHTHRKGGQILLVTGGRGWYQEEGKPAQQLKAGDVVAIPAEAKHWHGAARDSWFAHLSINVPAEGATNSWLEPVSDADYGKLP